MKTKSSAILVLYLLLIFLLFGCIKRESEILSTSLTYVMGDGAFNDPQSGIWYADGLFKIGGHFIYLDKFEVGRHEISVSSGNAVIDSDRWRSDYHDGPQGYIEITNIGTFKDFYVFDGNFEFNTYNRNNHNITREYRNGIFKNILVEASSENLSMGYIQVEVDSLPLRQYVCDAFIWGDFLDGTGSLGASHSFLIRIPINTPSGTYSITAPGIGYPISNWKFKYSNNREQKYYSIPHFDDAMGWPIIIIEESDFDDGYIRGTVSGYFTTNNNELVNITNGSFEFNW